MKVSIICVGKLKEKYLKQAIDSYANKIKKYCNLEIIEVIDEKTQENMSITEEENIKIKEGKRIISKIRENSYIILLAIEGKIINSNQLKDKIKEISNYTDKNITFIIGGSLGVSKEVMDLANYKLSFSKMTFPHQLMRLILVEQISRIKL